MYNIKLLISDFDGVFTNSKRLTDESGRHFKSYNMKDGMAIKNLLNNRR